MKDKNKEKELERIINNLKATVGSLKRQNKDLKKELLDELRKERYKSQEIVQLGVDVRKDLECKLAPNPEVLNRVEKDRVTRAFAEELLLHYDCIKREDRREFGMVAHSVYYIQLLKQKQEVDPHAYNVHFTFGGQNERQ